MFVKCTALIFILIFTSCATFRDGANPPITTWPPESAVKKTTSVQITIQVNGCGAPNCNLLAENWRKQVELAYKSSGYFSPARGESNKADIRADISITEITRMTGGNIFLCILTGVSMSIIPCYDHYEFFVKTIYKDYSGNILGSFEKSESANTLTGLFLLPVMPFKPSISEFDDVLFDLNRNTIIDAHHKGLF